MNDKKLDCESAPDVHIGLVPAGEGGPRPSRRNAPMAAAGVRRSAVGVVAGSLLAMLVACGAPSDADQARSIREQLGKKDYTAAVVLLKGALETSPQSGELRFLLGQTLLRQGNAAGALVELEKARLAKYKDAEVLPVLARAMLARAESKKVIEQFKDTVLDDAKSGADLKVALASAYLAQGDPARSRVALDAALKLDAKNVAGRLMLARLNAGSGDLQAALATVDAVLAEPPESSDAWTLKGELLASGKKDLDGGAQAYRKALAIDPSNLAANTGLIELLSSRDDVAGFKAQVAALVKLAPGSIEAQFYAVELALLQNELKPARDGAQRLLLQLPDYPPVLQLAGMVSLRTGELALAQKQLWQAIQLAPTVAQARRLLAQAYLRSGQTAKAGTTIQPLLDLPSPADVDLALAAQAAMQDGDLARAEVLYGRAAKANPQDTQSRVALALAQVAKGNAKAGLSELESLSASDKSAFADLALISAQTLRNDLDAALLAVDRLEGKLAGKPLPHLLRARLLSARQDRVGARASLDKALAADPVFFPALAELALLDVNEGTVDQSLKRFEAVLVRDPQNLPAALAVVDLKRRLGVKSGELEASLVDIVKRFPTDPAPRLALIQHHLAARAATTALAAAQEAVAALPGDFRLLDALAQSQLAAGDLRQALATLQKVAVGQSALPEPYLRLAEVYAGTRDYAQANSQLQRALQVSPRHLGAQQGLVRIALARKQVPEALRVARIVQSQRPAEAVGFLMEADIHSSQQAWPAAIGAYKSAMERQPASATARRLYATYAASNRLADAQRFASDWLKQMPRDVDFLAIVGEAAIERQDFAAAEAAFRQASSVLPKHASLLNNLAVALLRQGKPEALPLAEQANALAPKQAPYLDTLASALAANKQLDKAIEVQQQAMALAPETPAYRLGLARLLVDAGKRPQAKAELDKLAALGSGFAGQVDVQALLKGL